MLTNYEEDIDMFLENVDTISLNKRGQRRRRKPKETRDYFTQETEDAIVAYLASNDQVHRNELYEKHIEYAFYKLSENIIHTFKFYYTSSDTIEELKHEVVTFLLEKLHLFNHSKNINDKLTKTIIKEFNETYVLKSFIEYTNNSVTVTQSQINDFISTLNVSEECMSVISQFTPPKAYSYFGTIAKRYLIVYNKENYKKLQEHATVEEIDEDKIILYETIRLADDENNIDSFIDYYVRYVDKYLFKIFPKNQDAKTADAILELFRRRETLEIFNKKALYIYIREITDVSTPQITKVTKKLDIIRNKLYNEYYQHGFIKM